MVVPDAAIGAAIRAGGLVAYRVPLEIGEFPQRPLWLRPEIMDLLNSGALDPDQKTRVQTLFKRFVVGGVINIVTAQAPHHEVAKLGDIRELKTPAPPFVEVRVKPPKYDLRFFGRFVGKDAMILSTFGMKTPGGKTGTKTLTVAAERNRCDAVFRALKIDPSFVPTTIQASLSNATFV